MLVLQPEKKIITLWGAKREIKADFLLPLSTAPGLLLPHPQKTPRREREIDAGRPRELRGESLQGLYFAAVLISLGLAAIP